MPAEQAAASSSAPSARPACGGVRLLAQPYVAIGIGSLTLELSIPLDDLIHCQSVDLGRSVGVAASTAECEHARVSATRLKLRRAAKAVRCLIDQERRQRGLRELEPQGALKRAAKTHTRRMLSIGCFSHLCPGEADLVGRVTSAGYLPCVCSWSVGENIAWGRRKQGSPAATVAAWMASPPHREMILTGSIRDVDVGVRRGKPGKRKARAATYTADFGYRN